MSATLPPELKQVRLALQQHRRQFGRQRIPDTLRRSVVDLLSSCPRKQLIQVLGISYKMLCRREREAVEPKASPPSTAMSFVRLPMEAVTDSAPDRVLPGIDVQLPDGVGLAFHGQMAPVQCLQLLQGLGYGNVAASASQSGSREVSV